MCSLLLPERSCLILWSGFSVSEVEEDRAAHGEEGCGDPCVRLRVIVLTPRSMPTIRFQFRWKQQHDHRGRS
jgi:hypothetical protein